MPQNQPPEDLAQGRLHGVRMDGDARVVGLDDADDPIIGEAEAFARIAFEAKHAELEAQKAQGAEPEDPDEYRAESIFCRATSSR